MTGGQESRQAVEIELIKSPYLSFATHAYQPPRMYKRSFEYRERLYRTGYDISSQNGKNVNDTITDEVYVPILGNKEQGNIPEGLTTSFYTTLRMWLKANRPQDYACMVENIKNTPDFEYRILGDPFLHVILPLLPPGDQQMLIQMGKQAYRAEFGKDPKGFWLPEMAVSDATLELIADAGYSFVVLREDQLEFEDNSPRGNNPLYYIRTQNGKELAVLVGNRELSSKVAYENSFTDNGDSFLSELDTKGHNVCAVDLETFGEVGKNKKGKDQFLLYISKIMKERGFSALEVKKLLKEKKEFLQKVKDRSSWSCEHDLGRWTGGCGCDSASERTKKAKHDLYHGLMEVNHEVDALLNLVKENWRVDFQKVFLKHYDKMFTGEDVSTAVKEGTGNEEITALFLVKMETLIGLTSCGWFFGEDFRIERQIPENMLKGARDLIAAVQEEVFVPYG